MKINEIVNFPIDFIAEACRELKYDEFHTNTINFVKMTKVGRVHIILNTADRPGKVRTKIEIHHDIYGSHDNKDHYTAHHDNTAKKAWEELEAKIYEKKLGGA